MFSFIFLKSLKPGTFSLSNEALIFFKNYSSSTTKINITITFYFKNTDNRSLFIDYGYLNWKRVNRKIMVEIQPVKMPKQIVQKLMNEKVITRTLEKFHYFHKPLSERKNLLVNLVILRTTV